jgi:hypothetical protein
MTMSELSTCTLTKRNFGTSVKSPEWDPREDSHGETAGLRKKNAELRARIEQMEQAFLDNQCAQEKLLEEKSNVIRELHPRIRELQEMGARQEKRVQEVDLVEMQRQLDEDRGRLTEDAEAVRAQMREMEVSISQDRAQLGRQRLESQRLLDDMRVQKELAVRDAGLRARLTALRSTHRQSPDGPVAPPPAPAKSDSSVLRGLFGKRKE